MHQLNKILDRDWRKRSRMLKKRYSGRVYTNDGRRKKLTPKQVLELFKPTGNGDPTPIRDTSYREEYEDRVDKYPSVFLSKEELQDYIKDRTTIEDEE